MKYRSKIATYARETAPENAARNNREGSRKSIENELEAEIEILRNLQEDYYALGNLDLAKACTEEGLFLLKWWLAFREAMAATETA